MPSPMLTTVPTLVNDVVSSKPAICCRIMSLISVGRTAMVSAPLVVCLQPSRIEPSCRLAVLPSCRLHYLPPSGYQPGPHLFQFIAHATVDNLIANTDDDAADDVRIDLESQLNLLASHSLEFVADVILLRIGKPLRRRHLGDRDSPLRPQLFVKHLLDLWNEHRSVALDEHPGEIPRFGLHIEIERGFQRLDPALRRDTRVGEIGRDPVIGDDTGEHGQIVTPGIERPLFLAEAENRLCVPFCRAAGHEYPFSLSRS